MQGMFGVQQEGDEELPAKRLWRGQDGPPNSEKNHHQVQTLQQARSKKSYNQQRSNNLQRLTDMESKSAAVAVEVCAEADSANIDSAQQRPAATLGDTTQLAVQLAAQLVATARASSLPATSVQPQCDGSITEVLQPPAAGSCPVAGGSEGDCADIDSAPLATTPSAITCVDIAHHHPTATLGDTTQLTAQPFATARASS